MNRIVYLIGVLIAICVLCDESPAQIKTIETGSSYDTLVLSSATTWTKLQKTNTYENINGFTIAVDGSYAMFVAFQTGTTPDTTAGERILLNADESVTFTGVSLRAVWVRAKTSSGAVCRPVIW